MTDTTTSTPPTASPVATPMLDPTLTLALALASEAAYDDFDGKPLRLPHGWQLADTWTGWDPVFRGGSEEKYGLLLRATDGSGAYIVAFRGTASLDDVLDDADVPKAMFTPTVGTLATPARVEAGFYGIYDDIGAGMTQSMRQQLQDLLAKHTPRSLYVTGHSLGGALAHLFAFDLSFGAYASAFTRLTTFASPRVGDGGWRDAYETRIPSTNSTRVYNQQDLVPKVPPTATPSATQPSPRAPLSPAICRISAIVVKTAIAMPTMPKVLPRRADVGCDSPFRAWMKQTEATR